MCIPVGDYPKHRVQSTLCGFAINMWGKGSVTTTINGDTVEIMRMPVDEDDNDD